MCRLSSDSPLPSLNRTSQPHAWIRFASVGPGDCPARRNSFTIVSSAAAFWNSWRSRTTVESFVYQLFSSSAIGFAYGE